MIVLLNSVGLGSSIAQHPLKDSVPTKIFDNDATTITSSSPYSAARLSNSLSKPVSITNDNSAFTKKPAANNNEELDSLV